MALMNLNKKTKKYIFKLALDFSKVKQPSNDGEFNNLVLQVQRQLSKEGIDLEESDLREVLAKPSAAKSTDSSSEKSSHSTSNKTPTQHKQLLRKINNHDNELNNNSSADVLQKDIEEEKNKSQSPLVQRRTQPEKKISESVPKILENHKPNGPESKPKTSKTETKTNNVQENGIGDETGTKQKCKLIRLDDMENKTLKSKPRNETEPVRYGRFVATDVTCAQGENSAKSSTPTKSEMVDKVDVANKVQGVKGRTTRLSSIKNYDTSNDITKISKVVESNTRINHIDKIVTNLKCDETNKKNFPRAIIIEDEEISICMNEKPSGNVDNETHNSIRGKRCTRSQSMSESKTSCSKTCRPDDKSKLKESQYQQQVANTRESISADEASPQVKKVMESNTSTKHVDEVVAKLKSDATKKKDYSRRKIMKAEEISSKKRKAPENVDSENQTLIEEEISNRSKLTSNNHKNIVKGAMVKEEIINGNRQDVSKTSSTGACRPDDKLKHSKDGTQAAKRRRISNTDEACSQGTETSDFAKDSSTSENKIKMKPNIPIKTGARETTSDMSTTTKANIPDIPNIKSRLAAKSKNDLSFNNTSNDGLTPTTPSDETVTSSENVVDALKSTPHCHVRTRATRRSSSLSSDDVAATCAYTKSILKTYTEDTDRKLVDTVSLKSHTQLHGKKPTQIRAARNSVDASSDKKTVSSKTDNLNEENDYIVNKGSSKMCAQSNKQNIQTIHKIPTASQDNNDSSLDQRKFDSISNEGDDKLMVNGSYESWPKSDIMTAVGLQRKAVNESFPEASQSCADFTETINYRNEVNEKLVEKKPSMITTEYNDVKPIQTPAASKVGDPSESSSNNGTTDETNFKATDQTVNNPTKEKPTPKRSKNYESYKEYKQAKNKRRNRKRRERQRLMNNVPPPSFQPRNVPPQPNLLFQRQCHTTAFWPHRLPGLPPRPRLPIPRMSFLPPRPCPMWGRMSHVNRQFSPPIVPWYQSPNNTTIPPSKNLNYVKPLIRIETKAEADGETPTSQRSSQIESPQDKVLKVDSGQAEPLTTDPKEHSSETSPAASTVNSDSRSVPLLYPFKKIKLPLVCPQTPPLCSFEDVMPILDTNVTSNTQDQSESTVSAPVQDTATCDPTCPYSPSQIDLSSNLTTEGLSSLGSGFHQPSPPLSPGMVFPDTPRSSRPTPSAEVSPGGMKNSESDDKSPLEIIRGQVRKLQMRMRKAEKLNLMMLRSLKQMEKRRKVEVKQMEKRRKVEVMRMEKRIIEAFKAGAKSSL